MRIKRPPWLFPLISLWPRDTIPLTHSRSTPLPTPHIALGSPQLRFVAPASALASFQCHSTFESAVSLSLFSSSARLPGPLLRLQCTPRSPYIYLSVFRPIFCSISTTVSFPSILIFSPFFLVKTTPHILLRLRTHILFYCSIQQSHLQFGLRALRLLLFSFFFLFFSLVLAFSCSWLSFVFLVCLVVSWFVGLRLGFLPVRFALVRSRSQLCSPSSFRRVPNSACALAIGSNRRSGVRARLFPR
jgi:hypothetical protein